jgi:precorrin-6A/cobalt-precorrin-6A reductase
LQDFGEVDHIIAQMQGADVVLDASHGFDGQMSKVGFAAARHLGVPFLSYARPGWPIDGHPTRRAAPDVTAAMALIGPGARVFSAAGWASLSECAGFPGERLFLRQTSAHERPAPFAFVEPVFGDPPFTVQSETALFKELRIDTLLARNLGGRASRPKVDAAEALGLQVILIARPALPDGAMVVDRVQDALNWVAAQ